MESFGVWVMFRVWFKLRVWGLRVQGLITYGSGFQSIVLSSHLNPSPPQTPSPSANNTPKTSSARALGKRGRTKDVRGHSAL